MLADVWPRELSRKTTHNVHVHLQQQLRFVGLQTSDIDPGFLKGGPLSGSRGMLPQKIEKFKRKFEIEGHLLLVPGIFTVNLQMPRGKR